MKKALEVPARLRREVFDRDEGRCRMCGAQTDAPPHHIVPAGMGCRRVHRIENLITLCPSCHNLTHCGKDSEKLQRRWEDWSRKRYGNVIDQIKRESLCLAKIG